VPHGEDSVMARKYQRGNLTLKKRANGPDAWEFLLIPVVPEGRMYVWPELPDGEVCPVKNNVRQPALAGLRPRTILTRIINGGDSCRPTRSDDLGCIEALSSVVGSSDDHAA